MYFDFDPSSTPEDEAPPDMGWQEFIVIGFVLACFAGVMVSALV